MELKLIGSTNRLKTIKSMKDFSYHCGRQCYTKKDFEEVQKEIPKKDLMDKMINKGHHSVFEHMGLNFHFTGYPKMFVMMLNNEKQYATSEKSARYTQMKNMVPEQKEKYDKWMNLLMPEINEVYPAMSNQEERKEAIKILAQENARYMTSVFTPTKMIHSLNLRQINYLISEFEDFYNKYHKSDNVLKQRLTKSAENFVNQTEKFKIPGLENQTDRHLSLFNLKNVEEHFGDVYSTSYLMSFAGLAQTHRHRTTNCHISDGIQLKAPLGFFVPDIVPERLKDEWLKDLEEISNYDFPQAQLVRVNERGLIEDFRSKTLLRMCGHPQYEIMKNTLETAKKYKQFQLEYGKKALKPKCLQGFRCAELCIWTGKKALERIV
ncbi:FAD-dependent thymidylate synthase [Candidatus Pacearchaeota archaeon]|nr:FAD-dependent thymidylate synthase [Candidatus Pacearchaeota archaeon]